ncbi:MULTISPECIES: hypothetical protein [unclassified Micromonospora]|uniref:hypothetical protein n=1 Tax=unclassified Micromonospora TaxID=2617518 RepID=UPI0033225949
MRRVLTTPTPGHPYDNGIYQAATRDLPAATVTESELPAYCCRMRLHGETGPECRRTNLVWQLRSEFEQITRERARVARVRSDWRARNLVGWVEFAERRLRFYLGAWTLPPECAGAPERRFAEPVRDSETVLPACTC